MSATRKGWPSMVVPKRMLSTRRRKSSPSRARQSMAMISEAGVMSNPLSIITPLVLAPSPVTM